MAFVINSSCISCGACAAECPASCIADGAPFVIDAAVCVSCGNCARICPVGAPNQA